MDVQALKALVLMCQHKVDGAQRYGFVALAIPLDLNLLQGQHRFGLACAEVNGKC